ncbi:MAG: hypothetical protein A2045_07480 [Rhodocyclales bacterium GWA2_65_20]|nr:MAG: hypothetical protein A2045_07480 [Rhodocyclales bacterium GWA2_65_20]
MGIFSNILAKLGFGEDKTEVVAEAAPAAVEAPVVAAPVAISAVDVVAKLEALAAAHAEKLNWKTSIVDLLKLLGLDSSLAVRKELAGELGGAAEKADFIFAAKSLLTVAIGQTAAPIYVALHELPAESWGYDGQTQAARKAGKLIGESA